MKFYITINTEVELDVNDIWPDGAAPENPTAEDVAEAMRDYGTMNEVVKDWELLYNVDLEVRDSQGLMVRPWAKWRA